MRMLLFLACLPLLVACHSSRRAATPAPSGTPAKLPSRSAVVDFAKKQLGAPYKYAGVLPQTGFDCSGLVSYVYAHFGMTLPRNSASQATVGSSVKLKSARPGDLIFFTGKDARSGVVGHVGIITRAGGLEERTEFIHAATTGVILNTLSQDYYRKRFMGIRSVLNK